MRTRAERQQRRVSLRRQPLTVTRWWALTVICTSMVLLAATGIAYTSYVDRQRAEFEQRARVESDYRWCSLLTSMNKAYSENPPGTATGQAVAAAILHRLRELGCPEQ